MIVVGKGMHRAFVLDDARGGEYLHHADYRSEFAGAPDFALQNVQRFAHMLFWNFAVAALALARITSRSACWSSLAAVRSRKISADSWEALERTACSASAICSRGT